eukprot:2301265-Rhodomonas_salina.1
MDYVRPASLVCGPGMLSLDDKNCKTPTSSSPSARKQAIMTPNMNRKPSLVAPKRGAGKRIAPSLPAPLTEPILLLAMTELAEGTRRATETCYKCFQVGTGKRGCCCALVQCFNVRIAALLQHAHVLSPVRRQRVSNVTAAAGWCFL